MRFVIESLRAPRRRGAAAVVLMTSALAACSSETLRFDNPNASPYASRSQASEVTGASSAPVRRVEAQPMHSPAAQPLPPPPAVQQPASVPSAPGASAGSTGIGSYVPSYASSSPADVTGGVTPPRPTSPPSARWDWDGGTAVTVRQGETVESLSRKYGVPVAGIVTANNLGQPPVIYPGQRIVIPRYNANAPVVARNAPRPSLPPAAGSTALRAPDAPPRQVEARVSGANHVHVVAPGETLHAIARRYNKRFTEITTANRLAPNTMVKAGDRIVIPGTKAAAAQPARPQPQQSTRPQAAAQPRLAEAVPPVPAEKPKKVVAVEPPQNARVATSEPEKAEEKDKNVAAPSGGTPSFRWPVRGRVVSAFGVKVNGQPNDGINLSVPEGTAIKAAEDGVVAYAGNELKGYGNLILVRHANGFVTAYAHASEIGVKRGDQVRRGQVIGKSGQTGNVNSPQLHFEIRKGAAPVDPTQYLPGA